MPIPFKLEYTIERLLESVIPVEQQLLITLTGMQLSPTEANRLWSSIQEHKWYLSESVGRDVGLRVATIDYCENIEPRRFNSVAA